jgi:hypothetical protein
MTGGVNLANLKTAAAKLSKFRSFLSGGTEVFYTDIIFSSDGKTMFVAVNDSNGKNGKIQEYSVRTSFVSTDSTFIREISFDTANVTQPAGTINKPGIIKLQLKGDGTKLYALVSERVKRSSDGGAVGWSVDKKYVESYLMEFALATPNSLVTINSTSAVGLYGNRHDNSNSGDLAEGATALGFVDGSTTNENTYRVVSGFQISNFGDKIYFTIVRGNVAAADSEISSDHTYFSEVIVVPLTTTWSIASIPMQTDNAGFGTSNSMIIRKEGFVKGAAANQTTGEVAEVVVFDIASADHVMSLLVIDVDDNFTSKLLHYDNFYDDVNVQEATYHSTTKVNTIAAGTIAISLHIDNEQTDSKSLSIICLSKDYFELTHDSSGKIKSSREGTEISGSQFSVYQYKLPSSRPRHNNYYNYDPTETKIIIKGGVEVYISNLKVNESKFVVGDTELTFIGLATKEVDGVTHYAIIVNPSGAIPLEVELGDKVGPKTIKSQPYMGDANAQSQIEGLNGIAFNDVINNGGNV